MAVKFSPNGWMRWLRQFVNQAATLHLMTRRDGKLIEVDDAQYGRAVFVGAQWNLGMRGTVVSAAYPALTWRFAAPIELAGYEVRDKDGDVIWSEEYPIVPGMTVTIHELEPVIEMETDG